MLILVNCRLSHSQPKQHAPTIPDTLSKYSYLILICRNDTVCGIATGFFYNHGKRHYFLTARHNLTGYDQFRKKYIEEGFQPDKILIRIFNKTGDPVLHSVNLQEYNKRFKMRNLSDSTDIEVFEVALPSTVDIAGIEDFAVDKEYFSSNPESIRTNGFLQEDYLKRKNLDALKAASYYGKSAFPERQKIAFGQSIYFKIYPSTPVGFSGAPVFFMRSRGSGITYSFAGVVSGSNFWDDFCVLIKPEEVFRKIREVIPDTQPDQ